MDGDGALDIVSSNFGTDDYSVLVNQGDGTFLALPDTPIGNKPLGVAAEDLNSDGVPDLVVALKSGNFGAKDFFEKAGSVLGGEA